MTATATPEKEINRLRDLKSGARDMFMMNPRIIMITEGENPRDYSLPENREHIDKLKASIKAHGVQQPLWVRYDAGLKCAILLDGECRLRSCLELIEEGVDIKSVPVIQKENGSEADRLIMALTANTGKPLSKWEDGTAFRKLHNYGHEIADIHEATGHSERYIREAIELAAAPQEIKQMLSSGTVTPAVALQTIRKSGGEAAATELAEKVKKARESAGEGRKQPSALKRERISTGVKFSDSDAARIRDGYAWALETLARIGTVETIDSIKLNNALDDLKLFPADLKTAPPPSDNHPRLFEDEPEATVIDGTKPDPETPAAPGKKKKAAK